MHFLTQCKEALLDLLFPASARSERIRASSKQPLPSALATRMCGVHRICILSRYEGRTQDAICALKFERNMRAADLLAQLLDEYLTEHIAEHALFHGDEILFVPIPLGSARERTRGFNQVEIILSRSALRPAIAKALVRTRETAPQSSLSRAQRLENMRGAFALDPAWHDRLASRSVILIDDVSTTGATLAEAASVLAATGARVECLALSG